MTHAMNDSHTQKDARNGVVSGDGSAKTIQDRRPNFRDKSGQLFLVRCFACGGEHGRENYIPAVATGTCAWCGWPNTKV